MEHVQVAFRVSCDASDLTELKVLDRPVVEHDQLATERLFIVLIVDVVSSVAHQVSVFLGKDLLPVVGDVLRFVVHPGIDGMKVTRLLLLQMHITGTHARHPSTVRPNSIPSYSPKCEHSIASVCTGVAKSKQGSRKHHTFPRC